MNDLKILKNYLAQDKANKLGLAAALGYSSTSPIDQWLTRKALPKFRRNEILRCINELEIKPKRKASR